MAKLNNKNNSLKLCQKPEEVEIKFPLWLQILLLPVGLALTMIWPLLVISIIITGLIQEKNINKRRASIKRVK